MSQENVEIVLDVMGAWNRRDLERMNEIFANYITIRDGKIIRSLSFLSWQQGLEAAGLAE